jgi:hypothetical protein
VRVPEEAGVGKARVTFSFAAWQEGNVAPTTIDALIAEPQASASGTE